MQQYPKDEVFNRMQQAFDIVSQAAPRMLEECKTNLLEIQGVKVENKKVITEGRKLVTIRTIGKLLPIFNADNIVVAQVDGWEVVVKKDDFKEGDECIFFEIDSFLPINDPRFSFLRNSSIRVDEEGVERFRLRTIKLRGQVSQGLVLPLKAFPELNDYHLNPERFDFGYEELLDVTKYEHPSEKNGGVGACRVAGNFPITIPKTDEERIQNIFNKYSCQHKDVEFVESLKLDGCSLTLAYFNNPDFFVEKLDDNIFSEENPELIIEKPYPFNYEEDQVVVCSRNLVLKHNPDTHYWKGVYKDNLIYKFYEYCKKTCRQLALQGELMGEGIQKNRENITGFQFYPFRVWDIDNKEFLNHYDFLELCDLLFIEPVPQLGISKPFTNFETIEEILQDADIKSIHHPIAEGKVYKSLEKVSGQTLHFKVINNKFLLKEKD